ncbi:MAG: hypothetical protein QXO01_01930 [Nitrososphaerota archaeon]
MDRKGKGIEKRVVELLKQGKGTKEVAEEVYGEGSEKAMSRVRAIAKKFDVSYERRKKFFPDVRNYLAGDQKGYVEHEYRHFKELYRRLRKLGLKRDKQLQHEIKQILLKRALKAQKEAELMQRRFVHVVSWLDHDAVARELAEECYEMARHCFEDGDMKNGQKFLELVVRFFKLSQKARFEVVAEEAQKALAKIAAKGDEVPLMRSEGGETREG